MSARPSAVTTGTLAIGKARAVEPTSRRAAMRRRRIFMEGSTRNWVHQTVKPSLLKGSSHEICMIGCAPAIGQTEIARSKNHAVRRTRLRRPHEWVLIAVALLSAAGAVRLRADESAPR